MKQQETIMRQPIMSILWRIPVAIVVVIVNAILGGGLLFFQFTAFDLRGIWSIVLAPMAVIVHLLTIFRILRLTEEIQPPKKTLLRLLNVPIFPSLVSGLLSIAFSLVFFGGIVYAEGCGDLVYQTLSPSGEKKASLYSGIGPAGFGECNYVYVYYEQYPLVRRDIYRYGGYLDLDLDQPLKWHDEHTLELVWSQEKIDLTKNMSDLPYWLALFSRS